jgi:hypothetical protein
MRQPMHRFFLAMWIVESTAILFLSAENLLPWEMR